MASQDYIDPMGSVYDANWKRVREEISGLLRNR